MERTVVLGTVRAPFGKFGGTLSSLRIAAICSVGGQGDAVLVEV